MIIREPFSLLFPKKPEIVAAIREHMDEHGFDPAYPVILGVGPWTDEPVLIDGHTRLMVADELGITYVPDIEKHFDSEDDALEYAIHNQRNRRNLTVAEIVSCLKVLDERKQRGGLRDMVTDPSTGRFTAKAPFGANAETETYTPANPTETTGLDVAESIASTLSAIPKGKSAEQTANLLGISTRKVERIRTIIAEDAPKEIRQAVLSGEKTINKAYNEVREIKKQEEQFKKVEASQKDNKPSVPVFNRTNDNIKWAKWTWNPVTGCKQGCYYCYAKELAVRFNNGDFEPKFIPARLPAPFNTKIPSNQLDIPGIHNVFVCSMSDLFGEWVEQGWIDKVLDACRKTPQWTYIFLTKNPKRLTTIKFPENSWVGTTVDIKARVKPALEYMPQVKAPVKFISAEPLLEDLGVDEVPGIDWVIIGARSKTTGAPEFQPESAWVERLHMAARRSGCKVYWKTNLIFKHPEEYPDIQGQNT